MATHMDVQVEGVTDPIDGFNNTKAAPSAPEYGPDSDDETLRFEEDDDLYASDADEADAKWVRKQVRKMCVGAIDIMFSIFCKRGRLALATSTIRCDGI